MIKIMKDKKFMTKIGHTKLILIKGDITEQQTDVIVNAANSHLVGGAGVDGAIHKACGPELLIELRENYGSCPTGNIALTNAGNLDKQGVKKIFHAVGPIWFGGNKNEADLLAKCYRNSINMLYDLKMKSISFPAISTGIYGYPIKGAAEIALKTVINLIKDKYEEEFDMIYFVLFSDQDFDVYLSSIKDFL